MDCLGCQEQFTAVLEGSDSTLAQACREHLQTCATCSAVHDSFLETVHRLRELPVVPPPPGLLRQIALAVDAEARPQRSWRTYWQPLTAGLSMAACCLMVMWAVVLHPTSAVTPSNLPRLAQVDYSLMTPPARSGAKAPGATTGQPGSATQTVPPRRGAARPVRMPRRALTASRGPQVAVRPFPDNFGAWGHVAPAGALTVGTDAPVGTSGKPVGSFAAGDPATPPAVPLTKTSGEVSLTFMPPAERVVGALAVGQLMVVGQAEANVTIRLQPRTGLRVLNVRDGVLYRGELRQGQKLELPVRMIASRPGAQRMQLSLEADVAGVGTQLSILIPSFAPALAGDVEKTVTLIFQDTLATRAIRQMAAEADVRVVLDEGLEQQLVTYDFSAGIPFVAALRTVCDGCGYRVTEQDGVWHVSK